VRPRKSSYRKVLRLERKTTAGIPAAVRATATGLIFPWPFKKQGYGADTHP
jgi:hypothetical protein